MKEIDAIKINKKDNIATALRNINEKENVIVRFDDELKEIYVTERVPFGHKFAIEDIMLGEKIIKYGEVIGKATEFIRTGSYAHIHNIESLRGRGDL